MVIFTLLSRNEDRIRRGGGRKESVNVTRKKRDNCISFDGIIQLNEIVSTPI